MLRRFTALSALTIALLTAWPASATAAMCAIDMGSNTFRRIAGAFENGRYVQSAIEKRTLGVGDDVAAHGRISEAKLAEIKEVLASFKAACLKEGASTVAAVGTAAFRDAPNGRRVVAIAKALGIRMEIATERRESQLAYLVGSLGRDGFAVVDNGSRSIELVARDQGTLRHLVATLGYRVAYDKFFADAASAADAVAAFATQVKAQASKAPFMKNRTSLIGVEFGEMAEILFEPAPTEGRILPLTRLKERLQHIAALSPEGFQALRKQKDIDRALPRLVVAAVLTEAFGYPALELTDRELGVGLIIEAGIARR
jgi:exopolyphosphatase/pppGpp-phosphohydrolase